MIKVNLGAEGEYGRRLSRFLEEHLNSEIRICHYTRPGQWDSADSDAVLSVMSTSFFEELGPGIRERMDKDSLLFITEKEEEEGWCRFHPPDELKVQILKKTGLGMHGEGGEGQEQEVIALFSPMPIPEFDQILRKVVSPGDLYLGMMDLGGECTQDPSYGSGGDMGDLCYYIHLREQEIKSRVIELSAHRGDDIVFVPSPDVFLPLVELSWEDYRWFFRKLKEEGAYRHVYVGVGCGMLGNGGLWSCFDRMILISSRRDLRMHRGCERILRSVQAGFGRFSGSCSLVYREDMVQGGQSYD